MYNTTNMGDTIRDGNIQTVFNETTNELYIVQIPTGWVTRHTRDNGVLELFEFPGGDGWHFGHVYNNYSPVPRELPEEFKVTFELVLDNTRDINVIGPLRKILLDAGLEDAAAADAVAVAARGPHGPDQAQQMDEGEMDGGKSNKRSIRRRRRSSSRKSRKSSRKSRKSSRKSRNARRK